MPYTEFAPRFTAELWEPEQWASLFKAAGIKVRLQTPVRRQLLVQRHRLRIDPQAKCLWGWGWYWYS